MSEPFVGEIQLFGFSYAPYHWALCAGQTLPIQQNTALFALLGTQYGGNGTTTFQLPNLCGRTPVSQGQGPGLSLYGIGETAGVNTVTLTTTEMPTHNHNLSVANGSGARSSTPSANQSLSTPGQSRIFTPGTVNTPLSPNTLTAAGGGLAHDNRQPFLAMNYSIALYGVFPSFN